MEDSGIIAGLNELLNYDNVRKDVDLKKIENEMAKEYPFDMVSMASIDPVKQFNDYIGNYTKELGISNSDLYSNNKRKSTKTSFKSHKKNYSSSSSSSSREYRKKPTPSVSKKVLSDDSLSGGYSTDSNSMISLGDANDTQNYSNNYFGGDNDDYFNNNITKNGSKLHNMTLEQVKQNHINDVIRNINNNNGSSPIFSLQEEEKEDEKLRMIDQIERIIETLNDSGKNMSRYKVPSTSDSYEHVEAMFKQMRIKYDTYRYSGVGEELIMMGGYLAEMMFDGKKEYLGRKPDLTDFSTTLMNKVNRMNYDTTNMVSSIVTTFSIPSPVRLLFEIVPAAILHTQKRAAMKGEKGLQLNNDFNNAVIDLDRPTDDL